MIKHFEIPELIIISFTDEDIITESFGDDLSTGDEGSEIFPKP